MKMRAWIVFVPVLVGVPLAAQQPNLELMAKWSGAEVVHYDVVAVFDGETVLLRSSGVVHQAPVKDRVEVSFDWSQTEYKLVGTPVVKNFPSTVAVGAPREGCPPARIDGHYEHADVTAAKGVEYNPVLELSGTRSFPAGAIPTQNETGPCGSAWLDSPARTEPAVVGVLVHPSMYLAMPSGTAPGVTLGQDGKTMTFVDKGWTYTYTLALK